MHSSVTSQTQLQRKVVGKMCRGHGAQLEQNMVSPDNDQEATSEPCCSL